MTGLYNVLFGQSPIADELLGLVDLTRARCGRFRDCYLNEDGTEVHVYTRNGGGNREHWDSYDTAEGDDCSCPGCTIQYVLRRHPGYITDQDDNFDCTYATIRFRVPEQFLPITKEIAALNKPESGEQKWDRLFTAMKKGEETPEMERGMRALEPLFAKLKEGLSK